MRSFNAEVETGRELEVLIFAVQDLEQQGYELEAIAVACGFIAGVMLHEQPHHCATGLSMGACYMRGFSQKRGLEPDDAMDSDERRAT